jgi:uncharacterized protein (TIGR03382 family)
VKTALLLLVALAFPAGGALASPNFPDALQERAGGACTPSCTVCHETNGGGRGTVVQPFGEALMELGLAGGGDVDALADGLDALEASASDVDGDGLGDVDELVLDQDPNPGGASLCDVPPPRYGCAALPGPAGASWLVLVLAGTLRRRARA